MERGAASAAGFASRAGSSATPSAASRMTMPHSPTSELFAELDRAVAQAELPEEHRPLVLREVRSQLERGERANPVAAVHAVQRGPAPRCQCDPPSSGNWCPRCQVANRIPPE